MAKQDCAVRSQQRKQQIIDRLNAAVDVLEILCADDGEYDSRKCAVRALQPPGENNDRSSINLADTWNGRAEMTIAAAACIREIITVGGAEIRCRPGRGRNHNLSVPVRHGDIEDLWQTGAVAHQRLLKFTIVECAVEAGRHFDIFVFCGSLDLKQHGIDSRQRARHLCGKHRRDISGFRGGGADSVGSKLPDCPADGAGRETKEQNCCQPQASQRKCLDHAAGRRFGRRRRTCMQIG